MINFFWFVCSEWPDLYKIWFIIISFKEHEYKLISRSFSLAFRTKFNLYIWSTFRICPPGTPAETPRIPLIINDNKIAGAASPVGVSTNFFLKQGLLDLNPKHETNGQGKVKRRGASCHTRTHSTDPGGKKTKNRYTKQRNEISTVYDLISDPATTPIAFLI